MENKVWNEKIAKLPGAHILQTAEWGVLKQAFGWKVLQKVWHDEGGNVYAAAQILIRRISLAGITLPYCVLYVPRGPMLDWGNLILAKRVIGELMELAKSEHAVQIKIDPEVILELNEENVDTSEGLEYQSPISELLFSQGWGYSNEQIQFKNTVWLDLTNDENSWLERMKPKTRYNIRLAQKKGVVVREVGEEAFPMLYKMYAETSLRDGFTIRNAEYYYSAWKTFLEKGMLKMLVAEVEGKPVSGLALYLFASRAWYLYGMSTDSHREKMPNYLLQWEAMRSAKAQGCTIYDLWGAPDIFDETDSMWGVYRFKEGLGGKVVRTIGAWDYSPNPKLYAIYSNVLPKIMGILRKRGKQKTMQVLDN